MFLKHLLSKQEAINLLELINECLFCQEKKDLVGIMHKLKYLIPFNFALSGMARIDGKGRIKSYDVVNINYPAEWLNLYLIKKYYQIDPVVSENFTKFQLQYWYDTYKIKVPQKEFLFQAEDFGLKKGYTYGLRNFKGTQGSIFSISGESLARHRHTEIILKYFIPHLHQALIRILNNHPQNNKIFLSARQKEILNWIGHGKSTRDISTILGISERTVNFHTNIIMQKLDVVNRPQAVAVAIGQGLIDIE